MATLRKIYLDLMRMRKVRHLLSLEVAIILVNALILSKLDYCNSILANITKDKIKSLQVAQNDAARLVFKKKRSAHVTHLLKQLHWLPIEKRIQYKICCIVHKSVHSECPEYINELLPTYVPTRNLRSKLDNHVLIKPKIYRKIGEQSFSFSAPLFWNSLPGHIRHTDNMDKFKSLLTTFLYTM